MGDYEFLRQAGRALNAGQTRTLLLTGNIHDLFCLDAADSTEYVPLVWYLFRRWSVPGRILVTYELNGPIRFASDADREKVRSAWLQWRTGLDSNKLDIELMLASRQTRAQMEGMGAAFDANLQAAVGKPTQALEMLRQMCLASRTVLNGQRLLADDLIILIEAADMLVPVGELSHLSDADRQRIAICQDWFGDPGFMDGRDAVVLLAESRSLLHDRLARLPQLMELAIPSPGAEERSAYVDWFSKRLPADKPLRLWGTPEELARLTAGLSIHALRQLLTGASHENRALAIDDVIGKVEEFIQSQLGEDIVEFKKPSHKLDQVVGFSRMKNFLREELIPRLRASGKEALPGAAVCGPIGGGKTFIFEAVAAELDMVVLVLKNIRSQWYGQTDVIFERLRRVLDALAKVLIFVDEADTQFGGVGADAHETERRLTGKVQAMMSDPRLRGKVAWLLMTARIHLLSPDIRRPGRVGDLIIPVLDSEGDDRRDFLRWTLASIMPEPPTDELLAQIDQELRDGSAATFACLRSDLKARIAMLGRQLQPEEVMAVIRDRLPAHIAATREYQSLQALVNCTRRSLLPNPEVSEDERLAWQRRITEMERQGIR
jgi:hypothetical protein